VSVLNVFHNGREEGGYCTLHREHIPVGRREGEKRVERREKREERREKREERRERRRKETGEERVESRERR
jgi:hypothetical protein